MTPNCESRKIILSRTQSIHSTHGVCKLIYTNWMNKKSSILSISLRKIKICIRKKENAEYW